MISCEEQQAWPRLEERPSHEVGCDGLVVGVPGEVGKLRARRVNVARRTIGELDADGVLGVGAAVPSRELALADDLAEVVAEVRARRDCVAADEEPEAASVGRLLDAEGRVW